MRPVSPRFLAVLLVFLVSFATPQTGQAQQDTCRWAHDNECDEARYGGTGACPAGTDFSDCRTMASAWQRLMDAVPQDIRARLGTDTCRWANDLECDDANFGGTGACRAGPNASDCRAMAIGGDNTCRWANDGECDEPGIGTGVCVSGTDLNDCGPVAFLRNRSNRCETAFNGICEEPGSGRGTCAANTDTADCVGRQRPGEARDHFFGHDDRVLVDVSQMPWRAMGLLTLEDGSCTATLIGARHIATAAHCLAGENGGQVKAVSFRAGAWGSGEQGEARILDAVVAPDYSDRSEPPGQGNGDDWAILTLDRDLGLEIGYVRPYVLNKDDLSVIRNGGEFLISQAGYSWDTGEFPSGHMDCRILTAYRDGSFIHTCDTTRGDSGSPLLTRVDGEWRLIAVDSQFYTAQPPFATMSSSHLAVDTRAFRDALRRVGLVD
jgi:protease YdgD